MGSKTTWYSGFVSSNRRSIEVRSSSTDCLIGSPTRGETDRGDPYRSRVHHAGTRAVRRRRRHRVRHRVDRRCLTVGRRHTEATRRQRAYTHPARRTDNRTTGQTRQWRGQHEHRTDGCHSRRRLRWCRRGESRGYVPQARYRSPRSKTASVQMSRTASSVTSILRWVWRTIQPIQCINLVRCSPHCVDGTRHE